MGYTEKTTQRTFDLKLNLHCENCANDVKKIVLNIKGVDSIDIDKDLKLGKATISGNVDPQTVIKKLKDAKKHAKLLGKEEEERPPEEMQIVLQQNLVRNDQRKVAPHPPDLISKSVDKPMERDIHDCNPKFWSILLIVACFYAYRWFQFFSGLISKSVDKPMERDIHDCNPKFWSILLIVACFCAYRWFQFLLGLISETVDKPMEKEIHDCDDHKFELKRYNKPFKCNKCREDGFTWGHRCKHCIYDLHKDCLEPKATIKHDLFPESIFEYSQKPGTFCDACGMEIHGHSYSCKKDNLDLHPACSKLPGKLPIGGTDFVLCKEFKYKCFWCKKEKPETKVAGLCYVSKRDKFSCHVHCLSLVMEEAWKRSRVDLDRNDDDDDAISKALEKVDLKHMATAKGSGGGLFPGAVTIFLKTTISILFGDPTGLIVLALTELVTEFVKELV